MNSSLTNAPPFESFPKMGRLMREIVITEKIDGTNAQILITPDGGFFTGSRNRWITPDDDNFGFSRWAHDNKEALMQLGPGKHFGEWWGLGIQRGYDQTKKKFSLFNAGRWKTCCSDAEGLTPLPALEGLGVVPILYQGMMNMEYILLSLESLAKKGSVAAPGFMDPEGIIIYHTASKISFKRTIKDDGVPKGQVK